MQTLIQQVKLLIRARYPILYLLTHEEQRVWRVLSHIASAEGMELWRWRRTKGLERQSGVIAGSSSATVALEAVSKITEPSMVVFWDLHHDLRDPDVIRWLRDLNMEMGQKKQSIVLMSSELVLPDELEKSVAILDVPLPSPSDSSRLLEI